MVTDVNNNKFYEMSENSDGTFLAKWGRVGGNFAHQPSDRRLARPKESGRVFW
ncbi:MAG: WGR domain-containing protein [Bacteroidia bacterium]|nr:WGR domain-containing protein [Bacteroidia bacterium]